jgi:hypothetical protein
LSITGGRVRGDEVYATIVNMVIDMLLAGFTLKPARVIINKYKAHGEHDSLDPRVPAMKPHFDDKALLSAVLTFKEAGSVGGHLVVSAREDGDIAFDDHARLVTAAPADLINIELPACSMLLFDGGNTAHYVTPTRVADRYSVVILCKKA